ncbi:hypothetical protein [Rhizobium sp. BK176]|uniref:hypothetical protein n=1 Tax=Rhizobium sp. BK176 TaxID=2587071 RepID=UPI002168D914|nr:hypothetical protein [Rhizobium sp. BK176]MCS4089320.1 hypothetical protein [Rhizobium sp. BK176]
MSFNTRDPGADTRITETPEFVSIFMSRLKSGIGRDAQFVSDDGRSLKIEIVDAKREALRIEIVTIIGHARSEWWTFDKFERFLSSGFIALRDGETHKKWLDNSRPKPYSAEEIAMINSGYDKYGFSWPLMPIPTKHVSWDALVEIPEDTVQEWVLRFRAEAEDRTVHLWSRELNDGTDVYLTTTGHCPESSFGFPDIHALVMKMRYETLQFRPASPKALDHGPRP